MLVKVGFSNIKRHKIAKLYGIAQLFGILQLFEESIYIGEIFNYETVYCNQNKLARAKCIDGRPPLFTAAKSLRWVDMKQFFTVNMAVLHEADSLTGLPRFMLATIGPTSDLE